MGQETYNTCPSAFISLLTILSIIAALYPRFETFIYNNDLKIESQVKLLNENELQ